MKNFLIILFSLLSLAALADGPVIETTPLSRTLLRSSTTGQAQTALGFTGNDTSAVTMQSVSNWALGATASPFAFVNTTSGGTNTAVINPEQFGALGNTLLNLNAGGNTIYVSGTDDSAAFHALAVAVSASNGPVTVDLIGRTYLVNTNVDFTNLLQRVVFQNGFIVTTNATIPHIVWLGGNQDVFQNINLIGPEINGQRSAPEANCGLVMGGFQPIAQSDVQSPGILSCRISNFETNVILYYFVGGDVKDSTIVSAGHECINAHGDQFTIDNDFLGYGTYQGANQYGGISYGPANAPSIATNEIAIDDTGGIGIKIKDCQFATLHKALISSGVQYLTVDDCNVEGYYGQPYEAVWQVTSNTAAIFDLTSTWQGQVQGSNMFAYGFNACRMNDVIFEDMVNVFALVTNSFRGTFPEGIGNYANVTVVNPLSGGGFYTNTLPSPNGGTGAFSDNFLDGLTLNAGLVITNNSSAYSGGNFYLGSPFARQGVDYDFYPAFSTMYLDVPAGGGIDIRQSDSRAETFIGNLGMILNESIGSEQYPIQVKAGGTYYGTLSFGGFNTLINSGQFSESWQPANLQANLGQTAAGIFTNAYAGQYGTNTFTTNSWAGASLERDGEAEFFNTVTINFGNVKITNGYCSTAGGFASTATNTLTATSTGITNTLPVILRVWMATGQGVELTNFNTGFHAHFGTENSCTFYPLQSGEALWGNSIIWVTNIAQ
ncbi:MAG TPA: hypothetical protein VNV43_00215 [Candidatus Acidoferrales bacterium]|jgi:hypothetical protein|nr:hypothetical protein [Candidatus Acidoferrales bacterium]